jgi:hypothetical protein
LPLRPNIVAPAEVVAHSQSESLSASTISREAFPRP